MHASGEKGGFTTTSVHKIAVEEIEILPKMTRDIGELYSSSHAKDKLQDRSHVLKVAIPENAIFIKTEYIALRGDRNDQESNFIQLMKLSGIDDPNVMKHLEQCTDKYIYIYTCHQVQDEMIRISYGTSYLEENIS